MHLTSTQEELLPLQMQAVVLSSTMQWCWLATQVAQEVPLPQHKSLLRNCIAGEENGTTGITVLAVPGLMKPSCMVIAAGMRLLQRLLQPQLAVPVRQPHGGCRTHGEQTGAMMVSSPMLWRTEQESVA